MLKNTQTYILEEDGRSLVVDNGVVTATSTPMPLKNTGDGWQEALFVWERDAEKHGVVRSYSNALGFINDAAKILQTVFHNQGIERKIFYLIQTLKLFITSTTFYFRYVFLYKGEFDLSTFVQEDTKTTINIMEGGVSKQLKANENTIYEIPFDDDHILVKMNGITIKQVANYSIPDIELTAVKQYFPPLALTTSELLSRQEIALFSQNFSTYFGGPTYNFSLSTNYFLYTKKAVTVRIKGRITVNLGSSCFFWFTSGLVTAADPTQPVVTGGYYYKSPVLLAGDNVLNFDFVANLPAEEKLFLHANKPFTTDDTYQLSEIEVSFLYAYPTTYVKAHFPEKLGKKIIRRITGSEDNFESPLLQSKSNLVVTSGDAIRGIEVPAPVIKTKFNDFYNAFNVVLNAGEGIENDKIIIDEKARFYNPNNPISLGNVKDHKITVAKEYMANTLKIGYPDPQVDDVNGKYAFNGSHLYSSPLTRVVKEFSLVSPYKADPYEIEVKRINLDGKDTTDNKGDNDVYLLNIDLSSGLTQVVADASFIAANNYMIIPLGIDVHAGQKIRITGSNFNDGVHTVMGVGSILVATIVVLDGTVVDESSVSVLIEFLSGVIYELKREVYDAIEGIPDESISSIFNIEELTPARLVEKHGNWFHGMFYQLDTEKLVFQSTPRNADLKTTKGTKVVQEKADIEISTLAAPLFIPRILEFTGESQNNLVDDMTAAPESCLEYNLNGNTFKGFLLRAAFAPETEKEQTYRLLCTPDTDTSKFVE